MFKFLPLVQEMAALVVELSTTFNCPGRLNAQMRKLEIFSRFKKIMMKKLRLGTSLVAQWLRICLPMQETRARSLVREVPTCHGAAKPVCHNYWACSLEPMNHNYWACTPQLLKPAHPEPVLHNKKSPHSPQLEKSPRAAMKTQRSQKNKKNTKNYPWILYLILMKLVSIQSKYLWGPMPWRKQPELRSV